MPSFVFEAQTIRIQVAKLNQAMLAALEVQIRQAAREFLRATIPLVPIDTGMAVGSFLNIGRFLRVAVPHGPGPKRRSRPYEKAAIYTHYDGSKMSKTPEAGASLSTSVDDAFRRYRNNVTFSFRSDVYHYILNDAGLVSTGHWRSFAAGQEAFNAYMTNIGISKLPNIERYSVKRNVRSQ